MKTMYLIFMMAFALSAECQTKKAKTNEVDSINVPWRERLYHGNKKKIIPWASKQLYDINGELFYQYPSNTKECYIGKQFVKPCTISKDYNKKWLKEFKKKYNEYYKNNNATKMSFDIDCNCYRFN